MHAMSIRSSLVLLSTLAAGSAAAAMPAATAKLPEVVAFEARAVGSATDPQPVTLRNEGNAPLRVGVLTAIGDFQVAANECPPALQPGASCTFSVQSNPTQVGPREGKIVVAHDDDNGSSEVDLLGIGIPSGEEILFNTVNLQFTAQGTAPVTRTLSLTNNREEPLRILLIEPTLDDFEVAANDCGYLIAPGVKCDIHVRFAPGKPGARNGLLWLTTNSSMAPHLIGLSGASPQTVAHDTSRPAQ